MLSILKTKKMTGDCSICSEPFEGSGDISATLCGHTFHLRCLRGWLDVRKTCPKCQINVDPKKIIKKLFFDSFNVPEEEDPVRLNFIIDQLKAQIQAKNGEVDENDVGPVTKMKEELAKREKIFAERCDNFTKREVELVMRRQLLSREEELLQNKLTELANDERNVARREDDLYEMEVKLVTKQGEFYLKEMEINRLLEEVENQRNVDETAQTRAKDKRSKKPKEVMQQPPTSAVNGVLATHVPEAATFVQVATTGVSVDEIRRRVTVAKRRIIPKLRKVDCTRVRPLTRSVSSWRSNKTIVIDSDSDDGDSEDLDSQGNNVGYFEDTVESTPAEAAAGPSTSAGAIKRHFTSSCATAGVKQRRPK